MRVKSQSIKWRAAAANSRRDNRPFQGARFGITFPTEPPQEDQKASTNRAAITEHLGAALTERAASRALTSERRRADGGIFTSIRLSPQTTARPEEGCATGKTDS